MGVDAKIFVHTTDGKLPKLDFALPDGVSFRRPSDHWSDRVDLFDPRPTFEVDNMWRYYEVGYERGPWPDIAAVIMHLLAAANVDVVWYDGDSSRDLRRVDADRLRDITEWWLESGTRPYRCLWTT